MPIAAFSALPPQISWKWPALSLEPRAGTPCTRNIRSRTGMPMQSIRGRIIGAAAWKFMPGSVMSLKVRTSSAETSSVPWPRLCAAGRSPMHPASDKMMGDGEGMRSGKPVGMLARDHQAGFVAIEPARILQFRAVDDDVLIGGARGAADHQRRRIGPGLGHVIGDVGAADAAFLENLAPDRVLDGLGRFDKAGEAGIHAGQKLLLPPQKAFLARGHQHDHHRVGAGKMLGLAVRALALPA